MKTNQASIKPKRSFASFAIFCVFLLASVALAQTEQLESTSIIGRKTIETTQGKVTSGKFEVWENRNSQTGRKIHLDFVVLHAQSETPMPDPLFFFVGGPGQAATTVANGFQNHWIRRDRDIVLLDQRGTGGDNRLAFDYTADGGGTLQQYLDPVMDEAVVRRNLDRLSKLADLRMYSTPIGADDVNEFRQAMNYRKINIMGGSYGTRACLVYLRRHGKTVRTATLAGCAPIEFRNPLYHAEGAQRALDMMFKEGESSEIYQNAFGDLRRKFNEIIKRLEAEPTTVEILNQSTGSVETVRMNRADFVAAVRLQMYYTAGSRQLPQLLCDAHAGNFRPFVVSSLRHNMALRQSLALGMLLSVTAAEDLARIESSEIAELTRDTFFGDARVRSQIAAGKLWPKSELTPDFGDPVQSDVPTLILSGLIDPVTPPKWGEMIHNQFPNSIHLVCPTAHDIGGSCVDQMKRQFLDRGTVEGLKTDCLETLKLPGFSLPKK